MTPKINIAAHKEDGISILESILKSRGITDFEAFFNPKATPLLPYNSFSYMEKAVSLIKKAISNKEKILIWGDFDADGTTSCAILYKTLKKLGADFIYFLPDRINFGHGLNLKQLISFISKDKIKLLITTDCGISNLKEISVVKSLGVKVIVTDHHEQKDSLPAADCILNPIVNNSLKDDLSVKQIADISVLSGAGVAYYLAMALLEGQSDEIKDEITALAAIGTIADVVPLTGQNRVIAAKGLSAINENKFLPADVMFKNLNINKTITSYDVAYLLAPRINAAGRLDKPDCAFEFLISDNLNSLDILAQKLDSLNKIRQNLCDTTYANALELIKEKSKAIILLNSDWHIGIIGIVAAKLVEKFQVPVFLMTTDEKNLIRCSIRGCDPYDISKILDEAKECFEGYGGHKFAGGFSANPEKYTFDKIKEKLLSIIESYSDEQNAEPVINVDMELEGKDVTFDLIKDLSRLEPVGAENQMPKFLFKDAVLISQKQIGKDLSHLSFQIEKDSIEFNCIFFKHAPLCLNSGSKTDLIFRPEINEFNNEITVKLFIENVLSEEQNEQICLKFYDHRQKTGILDKINKYISDMKGIVKVFAQRAETKKNLSGYEAIKNNIIMNNEICENVMLFDYPPTVSRLKELMKSLSPKKIHLMKSDFSHNPDYYFNTLFGMLKYTTNSRNGQVEIIELADALGLSESCIQIMLEIMEKNESIRIDDINKIYYLAPISSETIHNDPLYEIFTNEFKKVISFKDYLQNADIEEVKELLKY